MYANKPAKIILEKLGLKGKEIPKKLINSITASLKKKNESLMTLERKIGTLTYEFSMVKVKDADYVIFHLLCTTFSKFFSPTMYH